MSVGASPGSPSAIGAGDRRRSATRAPAGSSSTRRRRSTPAAASSRTARRGSASTPRRRSGRTAMSEDSLTRRLRHRGVRDAGLRGGRASRAATAIDLVAWWVPGATPDAPAVDRRPRHGQLPARPGGPRCPAGMLHRYGFAVAPRRRARQGDSEVIDGRYSGGHPGVPDALGAWDWLRERGLPAESIGLLGESNGASTVVIAAGEEPGIAATWEDSGYCRHHDGDPRGGAPTRAIPEILTDRRRCCGPGSTGSTWTSGARSTRSRSSGAVRSRSCTGRPTSGSSPTTRSTSCGPARRSWARTARVVEPWFVTGGEHVEAAFLVRRRVRAAARRVLRRRPRGSRQAP